MSCERAAAMAASNAAARWGLDATTTTATSPTTSVPTRCSNTESADLVPARTRLSDYLTEAWHNLFDVGLVLERRHARSIFGVVEHRATERYECAAAGEAGPFPRLIHRRRLIRYADPVAHERWSKSVGHGVTLWMGPTSSRSERAAVLARRAMISAQIATAVSSGVRAPIARPIGTMISLSREESTPALTRRSTCVVRDLMAPRYPTSVDSAATTAGTSNL